jgi:hypothetical protein
MAFMFRLEDEDGEPADPPTLKTAVPNWRPGDTIPLGGRTLRVVAVAPRADPDGDGVLVVEDGRTRLGNRRPGRRRGRRARSPSLIQPYATAARGLFVWVSGQAPETRCTTSILARPPLAEMSNRACVYGP